MASIILNKIFYPDIVNIILNYVMISKNIVRQIKNVNMDYLEKLSAQSYAQHEKKSPKLLLRLIRLYREGGYHFLKRMSDI